MPAIPTLDIAEEAQKVLESLSLASEKKDNVREIRVLVTGFGPWSSHGSNPSSEIVRILPDSLILHLPPEHTDDLTTPTAPGVPEPTKVRITLHRLPDIPVSYRHVLKLLPALLEKLRPELILHVGLYSGSKAYEIELGAPFGQYQIPDVLGFSHGPITPCLGGRQYTVGGTRMVQTGLDHPRIVKLWQRRVASLPPIHDYTRRGVVGTDGVGDFLCGFIYLHSLLLDPASRAIFLHVPDCPTQREVEEGREVTECLLRALVQSYLTTQEASGRTG